MKSKYVLLASTMLISVATFAQKDQIKAAEKALKAGKSDEAKTILLDAESVITNATEAEKAQYYFVKGNVMLDNWCVDTKGYPLFRVSYDAVGTVPVAVNGSMLMMNGGSGWLSIIERSSTQTDREWLDVAKDTYHFQSQK